MKDEPNISVTAKYKILKFAEGADPNKDQPFEVVEKEEVITGEAAIALLNSLKGGE